MSRPRLLLLGVVAVMAHGATARAEETNTCISCHLEEKEEELSAPVEEWRQSSHAKADVSCDACHGGDPFEADEELSMSEDDAGFIGAPGWYDVPELCGACHEDMLDGYKQSVMAAQIDEGKRVAVCTTCHMMHGHDITRIEPREILTAENCGKCHDPQRAFDLLDVLNIADEKLRTARTLVVGLHGRIETGRLDRELAAIESRYLVAAHTYNIEHIREIAEICSGRLDAVSETADELEDEVRLRRRLGTAAIGFFTFVCIGALRLERNLRRKLR